MQVLAGRKALKLDFLVIQTNVVNDLVLFVYVV